MINKRESLESSIYWLYQKHPFYGSLIQEINIAYSERIPTAAISFDKEKEEFYIYLNPTYFCPLTLEQRVSILQHEVMHFTHGHFMRFFLNSDYLKNAMLYNIAADISINQFIENLPEGCMDVDKFMDAKGKPFPKFQAFETYYDLLKDPTCQKKNKIGTEEGPKEFDRHEWEELNEDQKKKLLQETKKIFTRSLEKTNQSFDKLPGEIKDLLKKLDVELDKLNYKRILEQVIKKNITNISRTTTWNRPNKRYGVYSPGSCSSKSPFVHFYFDTSGSISHKEINNFLHIMSGFLKAGSRNCMIGLWHTSLYHYKKYKLNAQFDGNVLQSGGTEVRSTLEHIKKENPPLAIIFTDGYYENVDIKLNSDVVWIISEGGTMNHPMKHIGKTISIGGIKNG